MRHLTPGDVPEHSKQMLQPAIAPNQRSLAVFGQAPPADALVPARSGRARRERMPAEDLTPAPSDTHHWLLRIVQPRTDSLLKVRKRWLAADRGQSPVSVARWPLSYFPTSAVTPHDSPAGQRFRVP